MAARVTYWVVAGAWLALAAAGARAQPAPQPTAAAPATAQEPKPEPEPEPVPEASEAAEAPAPKAKRHCASPDVLSGVCTEAEAAQASAQKPWRLMARAELALPVIFDDSPETEMLAYYDVGAEIDLPFILDGLYAMAWVGLIQRFYRYSGQSPVDFEDPLIALGYRHSLALGEQKLIFQHRFGLKFPASRPSRHNLTYTSLDWQTAARYPLGNFTVGANVWMQLEFRQYGSQVADLISTEFDEPGGANTVVRLEGAGVLQYTIFDMPSAGSLLADASIGYRHRFKYDGSYEPDWYWALGALYTPISYFSVGLSLEQGYSDLLRGGVPELVFFDRNETTWHIALYGRY